MKFKQTAGGPQTAAAGSGGGWFANLGKGFGTGVLSSGGPQKEDKAYKTCLTYMKSFQGKRVIMTGGTGGIGSKVAKKLLKAGKEFEKSLFNSDRCHCRDASQRPNKGGRCSKLERRKDKEREELHPHSFELRRALLD